MNCPPRCFKRGDVGNRRFGNRPQRVGGEEGLMPGAEHIGKCQQSREHIILDHLFGMGLQ